jgi:hypothetical protein
VSLGVVTEVDGLRTILGVLVSCCAADAHGAVCTCDCVTTGEARVGGMDIPVMITTFPVARGPAEGPATFLSLGMSSKLP